MNQIVLWQSPYGKIIPKTATVSEIMNYNDCLSQKDVVQLSMAYQSEAFEMAANFIWEKTMNKLREYILSFGDEFALEMLGMRDPAILQKIPEKYAIDLSYELGIIPKIGKIKLTQCNEVISYYLSSNSEEEMDASTINFIIRTCVEYVLQQNVEFHDFEFCSFRDKLKDEALITGSSLLSEIESSPYFYKKTIVRTLLNLVDTEKGVKLDNTYNNLSLIIPIIWDTIASEDRWLIGTAYTEAVNTNNTRKVAVFKNLLLKLKGFDYVPENVRSNTFIDAAKRIIATHNGMNNFYNEPGAVDYLASLGTVIPGPAVGVCLTALLCVKLGSRYGYSFLAQGKADELLKTMSKEKRLYYYQKILPYDELILEKLKIEACAQRWCELEFNSDLEDIKTGSISLNRLITATKEKNLQTIRLCAEKISTKLYD